MLNSRAGKFTTTITVLIVLFTIGATASLVLAQDTSFIESERGSFSSFQKALDQSQDGDTITVTSGIHAGNFVIYKSITIQGIDWPQFDGGGDGNVFTVEAPDVTITGLVIKNSGDNLNSEDAGIEVNAQNVLIEGNRIQNTLFGIYLKQAPYGVLRNNVITGMDLEVQRRGDGIRVWYSSDTVIEENDVSMVRDVVLWYSERLIVRKCSHDEPLVYGQRIHRRLGNRMGFRYFGLLYRPVYILGDLL